MGTPALLVDEVLSRVPPESLGQEITLLSAQINVANHRLLRMIAAFDRSGGWRCNGAMRSCAHWLAANTGIDLGAAREKVRVARRLEGLPEVDAAFAGGELSYSKVRAITRVATNNNQGFLLGMAERSSAGHLERVVSRYRPVPDVEVPAGAELLVSGAGGDDAEVEDAEVEDAEGERAEVDGASVKGDRGGHAGEVAETPCEEVAREHQREMFWFQDEDGMWVFHARLPPEQGQLVMKALEAVAGPLQKQRQDEFNKAKDARLKKAAQALAKKHRLAGVAAPGDESAPAERSAEAVELERVEEKISAETYSQFMGQIRADALSSMVEHFLANAPASPEGLQSLKGAERCQVVLHVDINTLRSQGRDPCCVHGRQHFENGPWISAETARRLSCDASITTVLEDEQGKVLNVGRRSRVVPAHIRRALMERDGVCQFPGCSESRNLDCHHVVHWADGGETSLDNLVMLCRFHHARLHQGCFDIRRKRVSAETSTESCASDVAGGELIDETEGEVVFEFVPGEHTRG